MMMRRLLKALRPCGPALFYLDFLIFPPLAIAIVVWECRSIAWAAAAIAGVLLFSFLEYWVHRAALHSFFYEGNHERHHTHPADYVVFPIWVTPAGFAVFWLVLPLPVFAGAVLGYVWFLTWHHCLHHFDLTRWPRFVQRYAIWHLEHHRFDDRNFGITIPLWDWLFGTYRRPA